LSKQNESEIEMLRKALKRLEPQKGLPFIVDKGYDRIEQLYRILLTKAWR
jgi:hypothetical protein